MTEHANRKLRDRLEKAEVWLEKAEEKPFLKIIGLVGAAILALAMFVHFVEFH